MVERRNGQARSKAGVTRGRILDSTAVVLAEKGYTDTSLNDIAKAAEMKAGSLYYHFESKDALIEETLRFGIAQTHLRVSEAIETASGADPVEQLKLIIEAQAREALDRSTYTAAHLRTISQIPADMAARLRPEMSKFNGLWRDVLLSAQRSGAIRADVDATSVTFIIIGAISYSVEWPASMRSHSEQAVRTLVEIVMSGLVPR
ncbi:TetR/AcrR family transcriptional regulator [Rhodococcus erythropolis]